MAAKTITTHSYTDDLAEGANLPAGQRVRVTLTDGEAVWLIDTNRANDLVATLKGKGTKQKRRGRKASK